MEKSADAFRTISEVAEDLDLPQHVLRFWETRFPQIRPLKRAGGRRFYRPGDIAALRNIRRLLYDDGYTIKGVQRLLKERGVKELREEFGARVDGPAPPLVEADDRPDGPSEIAPAEPDVAAHAGPPVPDRALLRDILAAIEDCERILEAARSA